MPATKKQLEALKKARAVRAAKGNKTPMARRRRAPAPESMKPVSERGKAMPKPRFNKLGYGLIGT